MPVNVHKHVQCLFMHEQQQKKKSAKASIVCHVLWTFRRTKLVKIQISQKFNQIFINFQIEESSAHTIRDLIPRTAAKEAAEKNPKLIYWKNVQKCAIHFEKSASLH